MIEPRRREGLVSKPPQALGIRCQRFGQNLDGDVSLEPRISRSVHLAHAACSEERNDLVGTESSSGRKGLLKRHLS